MFEPITSDALSRASSATAPISTWLSTFPVMSSTASSPRDARDTSPSVTATPWLLSISKLASSPAAAVTSPMETLDTKPSSPVTCVPLSLTAALTLPAPVSETLPTTACRFVLNTSLNSTSSRALS
ncbi:hypothetical protein D9M68_964900 [compost metagenome]